MGLLPRRRRSDDEVRLREILEGSRTVASRLDAVADRLDEAVARLASEIADPNDQPDQQPGDRE